MEVVAISLGLVGVSAVAAWWDIQKRKANVAELAARLAKVEEHMLEMRNNIAGLKGFVSSSRKVVGR